MRFKAKLFKLGNSKAVYIPKDVYTDFEDGAEITLEVITDKPDMYIQKQKKTGGMGWCDKHDVRKVTCGCK